MKIRSNSRQYFIIRAFTKLSTTFLFLALFNSSFSQIVKEIVNEQERNESKTKNRERKPRKEKAGNNDSYFKIGIYEATLGYSRKLSPKIGLGIEGDYRPQLREEGRYRSGHTLLSLAYSGFRAKLLLNGYVFQNNGSLSLVASYRYLESGNMIYDPGKLQGLILQNMQNFLKRIMKWLYWFLLMVNLIAIG